MFDVDMVKERLQSFGVEVKAADEAALQFCVGKVTSTIRNDINHKEVPEGLEHIATDMAVGEFLQAKKTFSPDDLAGVDFSTPIKQIQMGDTSTTFATGEGTQTAEERLSALITYLLSYGREEFNAYRRIRW
jgi:methionine aminopeptidase